MNSLRTALAASALLLAWQPAPGAGLLEIYDIAITADPSLKEAAANRMATLKFVEDIPLVPGDPGFPIVQHVEQRLTLLKEKPMLICWGAHDFVFDRDYYDEWRRRFPDARACIDENAGHYILEDIPDRLAKCVKQFLNDNKIN